MNKVIKYLGSFVAGAIFWHYLGGYLTPKFVENTESWLNNPAFIRKYWRDLAGITGISQ